MHVRFRLYHLSEVLHLLLQLLQYGQQEDKLQLSRLNRSILEKRKLWNLLKKNDLIPKCETWFTCNRVVTIVQVTKGETPYERYTMKCRLRFPIGFSRIKSYDRSGGKLINGSIHTGKSEQEISNFYIVMARSATLEVIPWVVWSTLIVWYQGKELISHGEKRWRRRSSWYNCTLRW